MGLNASTNMSLKSFTSLKDSLAPFFMRAEALPTKLKSETTMAGESSYRLKILQEQEMFDINYINEMKNTCNAQI